MIDGEVETYIDDAQIDTSSYKVLKGNFSVLNGALTITVTHRILSPNVLPDLSDSGPWRPYSASTTDNIVSVDSKIHIDSVYKRDGSGTGLNGTWSNDSNSIFSDGSEVMYRSIITISGSTGTSSYYSKEGSNDWIHDPHYDYDFSLSNTIMKIIGIDQDIPYILAGNYLITEKGYGFKK